LKIQRVLAAAGCLVMMCSASALADNGAEAAAPPAAEERVLQLAGAYQSGYLTVVSTACFQLYSSMGIIATDLSAGHISGATALGALEQNALLLSVCADSLADVQALTAASDTTGTQLLSRIEAMLTTLGALHSALVDAASAPRGDKAAQQAAVQGVETARKQVEAALEQYAKPLAGAKTG
jgi:hypothetical protein